MSKGPRQTRAHLNGWPAAAMKLKGTRFIDATRQRAQQIAYEWDEPFAPMVASTDKLLAALDEWEKDFKEALDHINAVPEAES